MKKLLPLTALALGLTGGVALADRGHDNGRGHDSRGASVEHRGNWNRGSTSVVHGNNNRGNYNRGNTVVVRDNHYGRGWNGGNRVIVRDNRHYGNYNHVVRRPIYVSRPIIRERYYNYYRRPAIVVENYGPRAGYFWVAGAWSWGGGEWIWQPGHYEPDQSYDYGYDSY